ncbi:MAG: lipid-A-disaccharide synthase [Bacteroidales bacterium]|nr:lipid-A-disaccharide synthase [Bacteroidales bacterium]
MRYYLIAGEASGDLHGSNLLKSIAAEDPGAEFRFRGGDLMAAAAGAEPVEHYKDGAVMGASDVLRKAPALLGSIRRCCKDISAFKPDAVILIDYPGFNLRIARYCHRRKIKVIYYIAPKTWASRCGRNVQLRRYVDRLFVLFPFEVPYFQKNGVPFSFKGNPLVDIIDSHQFICPSQEKYIAVLPGSRTAEISRMMPICMEIAESIGMKVIVAGAPSATPEDFEPYMTGHHNVQLLFGRTYDILKYAQAAIINSGTASLEAALIGTPQVVCWSTSNFNWWYANKLLKVQNHINYISLGNLCLGRPAFKELLQSGFNKASVMQEIRLILDDSSYRARMLDACRQIRELLGGPGASEAIAREITMEINPT